MDKPTIFKEHAAVYHAHGLQAIPLYAREKRPIITDWSRYADISVDAETSAQWIERYPDSNLGLVLGKSSGLIMIDIDTDDVKLIEVIKSCLPPSPWQRFGRKGMMLAYKYSPIKTHRIKNSSGQTIVECLSSRTQCVLPPSIHPDTGLPYRANSDLIDVLPQLNFLPENVEEILRSALANAGVTLSHSGWSRVTDHVSAGSRDSTLTELAGLFAYAILRGERTLKEAIGMLRSHFDGFVEKVAGDNIDCDKHVDNLIKFLHRDVLDKGKVLPRGWDEGLTEQELKDLGVTLSIEDTEWSFEEITKYLQEEFEAHPDGKARADVVERILAKVAKSNQLTKIDEDRILKYIVDVSMLGVPVSTYRGRLRELRTGDVRGNDHSEIARAVLKDLEQYSMVAFYGEKFMKWSGSHWIEMDKNSILSRISSDYGHLDACKRSSDIRGIMSVLSFLMENEIRKKDVQGINFANGFLTSELKLLPHDPEYGTTYTLPFRYLPEESGKFPMFAEFLNRAWGQDEDFEQKMMALQEAMCVALFGMGSRFQRAILLHGAPRSGKTQLLRILEAMLPPEAKCAVPPEQWNDKFMPAQMHNKLVNVCGELSERRLIDGQVFKDIIDGSEISVQYKGQQIFTMRPTLSHWFASNHLPRTTDTSAGFIRRWLILTFSYPVASDQVKTDIGDLIACEEREAIVAWATQAMPRLLKNNEYTQPQSHFQLTQDFANNNNNVRFFLQESGKCKFGVDEGYVNEVTIYNKYHAFCLGAGSTKPVSSVKFRQLMRELGHEFNFKIRVTQMAMGGTDCLYEGLVAV